MIPQGSTIINTQKYDDILAQIESANSCKVLQELTTKALESVKAEQDAIQAQSDKVAPLLDLLEAPTDPSAVIDWIKGLIDNLITPLTLPAINYPLQQAATAVKIAEILDAINKKASTFTDCSIDSPI